ncbi:hypothetical protein QBC42DRAFT_278399 [Cladorrhinum samala]|uniref:Secreted protein n=1 Tax=Cladorrhinum samala TaxID=585594 RepID=A0AAV9HBF2_9PEZI|nr:hypothetical protein QBC42DRAFT_278399 [Cladorrhinum samala]
MSFILFSCFFLLDWIGWAENRPKNMHWANGERSTRYEQEVMIELEAFYLKSHKSNCRDASYNTPHKNKMCTQIETLKMCENSTNG